MATKKTKINKTVEMEKVEKPIEEVNKVEEQKEKVKQETKVKKTKSQIFNELKKNESNINVEILNIGVGSVCYMNRLGQTYFDLDLGESDIISLGFIKEVCMKSIGFFRDFAITITNIFLDEVEDITQEDVIAYLGLDKVYKDIENYDTDFIKEFILDSDAYEFEKELKRKGSQYTKMIACKMIQLYHSGEDITRDKESVVCRILEVDKLNMEK